MRNLDQFLKNYGERVETLFSNFYQTVDKSLFQRFPILILLGARMFQFLSSFLCFLQTRYMVHLFGLFVMYCIIRGHPEYLDALAPQLPAGTPFWERLLDGMRVVKARRAFFSFLIYVVILIELELFLQMLTFVPSVREKISCLEGERRIETAQTFSPFRKQIFPPLLFLIPFVTIPIFAAKMAFLWVQLITIKSENQIIQARTNTIRYCACALAMVYISCKKAGVILPPLSSISPTIVLLFPPPILNVFSRVSATLTRRDIGMAAGGMAVGGGLVWKLLQDEQDQEITMQDVQNDQEKSREAIAGQRIHAIENIALNSKDYRVHTAAMEKIGEIGLPRGEKNSVNEQLINIQMHQQQLVLEEKRVSIEKDRNHIYDAEAARRVGYINSVGKILNNIFNSGGRDRVERER
jgi:hypothetical protein